MDTKSYHKFNIAKLKPQLKSITKTNLNIRPNLMWKNLWTSPVDSKTSDLNTRMQSLRDHYHGDDDIETNGKIFKHALMKSAGKNMVENVVLPKKSGSHMRLVQLLMKGKKYENESWYEEKLQGWRKKRKLSKLGKKRARKDKEKWFGWRQLR